MDSLGEQIRRTRIALGWNQAELASISGVSRAVISEIETGKSKNPSIRTLWKLARALGMSLSDLFRLRSS